MIFTAVFIMSNLSTNSVEQAKETCLYLENPNVVINDSLKLNQTDISDGEDFEGISRCSFFTNGRLNTYFHTVVVSLKLYLKMKIIGKLFRRMCSV